MSPTHRRITPAAACALGIIAGWVFLFGLAAGTGKLDADLIIFGGAGLAGLAALIPAFTNKNACRVCTPRRSEPRAD